MKFQKMENTFMWYCFNWWLYFNVKKDFNNFHLKYNELHNIVLILYNLHLIIIICMFFIYHIHLLTFMHIQITAIQVTEFFIIKRQKRTQ